ncbi:MAG: HD domain-containing protein [Armatimonadetes bacterium]|nr:HD domain-containing protein [Armatimonadota bacterium]
MRQAATIKQRQANRLAVAHRLLILLTGTALLGIVAMRFRASMPDQLPIAAALILFATSLAAESVPVELSRRGLRLTFTLPFVAAMAVIVGPIYAVALDTINTVLMATLYPRFVGKSNSPVWVGLNAAISANSCVIGSAVLVATRNLSGGGVPEIEALAFMLGYGASNLLLISHLESVLSDRPPSESLTRSLRLGALSFGLYALTGLLVVELCVKASPFLVPLALIPVLSLRRAIRIQTEIYDHYYETIAALSQMLRHAHPYTHGHLERVAIAAEEVARRLGMSAPHARLVREAAVLHDIGKIAVSEDVLDKPAKLDPVEMEHVRCHSEWGAEILEPVKPLQALVPWIRHHHERPDGAGYPDRLPDEKIPVESKIIAVVDAFDAMTGGPGPGQQRTYRAPRTVQDALAELERCSGTQFDPQVVKAFREVVEEGYAV